MTTPNTNFAPESRPDRQTFQTETWRTDKTAAELPEAKSTQDAVSGVMEQKTERDKEERRLHQGFDTVEQAKAFLIAKGLPESEMWIGTRPRTPENGNPDPYYTIYIKGHKGTTYDRGVAMKGVNPLPLTYTVNIGGRYSVHLAIDTIGLLKTRGLI